MLYLVRPALHLLRRTPAPALDRQRGGRRVPGRHRGDPAACALPAASARRVGARHGRRPHARDEARGGSGARGAHAEGERDRRASDHAGAR